MQFFRIRAELGMKNLAARSSLLSSTHSQLRTKVNFRRQVALPIL